MTAKAQEQLERECAAFYYREAEILDNADFAGWLDLIHADIDYRVPVRTTRDIREGDGFSAKAYFMQEDFNSLKMRAKRVSSPYAWAENPRTRTRRMVGNLRVRGAAGNRVEALTNLAVFCHRSDASTPLILTCERKDVLEQHDGEWKLVNRMVLLDTTVLGLESLSIFL